MDAACDTLFEMCHLYWRAGNTADMPVWGDQGVVQEQEQKEESSLSDVDRFTVHWRRDD